MLNVDERILWKYVSNNFSKNDTCKTPPKGPSNGSYLDELRMAGAYIADPVVLVEDWPHSKAL